MNDAYNVVNFPADCSGCGFYRMKFPMLALETAMNKSIRFVDSQLLITDPTFFRGVRTIRVQRQVNDIQAQYFLNVLKKISNSQGQWIIYEIDDVIGYEDIPEYNLAKDAFKNKFFFSNVKSMLHASDLITVTTEALKMYYVEKFEVEAEKVIVIPNYLPRWWIGEVFSNVKNWQVQNMKENRNRPRIGLPLSGSHYNMKAGNTAKDDISGLLDFIRSTVKQYNWCFIGHCPPELEDLAKDKKIEIQPGSDLLNYPRELWRRKFQAIVAPLQDNIFNRCKSNIKLLESWAIGIPCIAQDLECYNKYTDYVFKDVNGLQNQLDRVFKTKEGYEKIIRANRDIIDFGDSNSSNGWWIEKNLRKWIDIYTLPQRTMNVNLENIRDWKKRGTGTETSVDIDLN